MLWAPAKQSSGASAAVDVGFGWIHKKSDPWESFAEETAMW